MTSASFTQHGIAVTERLSNGTTAYHMPIVIEFDGSLDIRALALACTQVVELHPMLANRIEDQDGECHLVAAAVPALEFAEQRTVSDEIARPFDLDVGPLSRFTLCNGTTLVITVHHLVFDGHSKDILIRDLAAAYRGEHGSGPALATFANHVSDERERVEVGLAAAAEFWRERLAPPAEVQVGGVTLSSRQPAPGYVVEFPLAAARIEGASRFEATLAALHVLLWRNGNAVPVTGVALSVRTAEMSDVIGPFVNELPVDSQPFGDQTFAEFVLILRARLRAVYAHRHVPLSRATTAPRPYVVVSPVSVSFRRRQPDPGFGAVGADINWTAFNGAVRGDLQLQIVDDGEALFASLRYCAAAAPIAEAFAAQLQSIAQQVADIPGTLLRDLDVPEAVIREGIAAMPNTDETAAVSAEIGITADSTAGEDDELMRQLREIWEDVLKVSPIGDNDDLFDDLSGHSLTITRIIARMRSNLNLDIPLSAFFDDPTIAGVARAVGAR